MYLYNYCSSKSEWYDEQELQKLFSLLHLRGIQGENLWYLLTAFPLVSKYHQPATILVVQYSSSKPAEGGEWVSWGLMVSFYITYTISHSTCGPSGRNLGLPSDSSCYYQTLPLDLGVLVSFLEEVLGYRSNHPSRSSLSDSRVHQNPFLNII